MADGVRLSAGSADGATIATDDDGTFQHQYVKLEFGADNTQTKVQASAPLPVQIGDGTDAALVSAGGALLVDASATTQPVSNAGLTALNGAISGTEVQVDVVGALPAGANAIGKLAANSGVDIGDVDVLSVVPGTGATNLGKAIDAVAGATDTGVVPLAIRDDTLAALTPVEGDYVPLRTGSTGALWVTPSGTVTVDGSGVTQPVSHGALTELAAAINASSQVDINIAASAATVAVSNAGITTIAGAVSGTEMQVDVVAALPAGTNNIGDVDVLSVIPGTGATNLGKAIDTAAGATDTGVASLAVRDDALSALTPIEGDFVPLRTDANGALWVIPSGTVTVDGSGVTQPVSNAGLTELAAAINASSQVDVNIAASAATLTVASHAVTNAGTFATQVDGSALTALQLIDDIVNTDDAAFTPGTGKVAAVGFLVDGTATDSADEGDIGIARMTADRAQIVVATERSGLSYESDVALAVKYAAIDAATSGDNTLLAAVTGKKIRVLSLFLVAAGTVAVRFENGAGGTALTGQMNLVANTGFVLPHNPHGWFQTADTTLLNLELSAAISVDGSFTYIEAE